MDLSAGDFSLFGGDMDGTDGLDLKIPAKVDTRTAALDSDPEAQFASLEDMKQVTDMEKEAGKSGAPAPAKYPCDTQAKASPKDLYLVWDGVVKLWEKGSTINFGIRLTGFPSNDHAIAAGRALVQAANAWNSHDIGVSFKYTPKPDDMCFVLIYGGWKGNTLATAPVPNPSNLSAMMVYARAFDSVRILPNVFMHELGHTLGLRHEFAPQEGMQTALFGKENPKSIMSYNMPPQMQGSDIEGVKALYNSTDNSIGGFPVVRYTPDN